MLGNEFSSTNSDDKQRVVKVTSEHKKCESQSTKVTYIRPSIYDVYNHISLIFCVVPDSLSLAANYCIYNYHG